ncbi:MAG TPA: DUF4893 domain-containing protein [Sphingomicrobium sp.]|nr:DUF4893 domain-containing protein [Sphingomicrobium sp.]
MRTALIVALLLGLTACGGFDQPAAVVPKPTLDWHSAATDSDRERLRQWRTAFTDALRAARASGHGAEIAREGALLDPDAALGGGPIPNGDYRCRVTKLGSKSAGMLNYVSYPAFNCRIRQAGAVQDFAKLSGSQRQVGSIFPGDPLRQVFLGTLVLGDETRALQYGRDTERDVAGYVERIGPNRWRLIMPRPHFESVMDVMELVPVQ